MNEERPKFYFTNRYPVEKPDCIVFDKWEDVLTFMKMKSGDTNFYVTYECDHIYVYLDNIHASEYGTAQYHWISAEEWEEVSIQRDEDDFVRAALTLWQNGKLTDPEEVYGNGRYEATDLDNIF